jgi:hypothetical protein
MSQNSKVPDPELVDKETKVLELRRAGLTWQSIAEQTGYADATGAYAAYKRVIKRTQQQPADELREQELDRIDRLQLAAWPNAMDGDTKSIMTIVKLMERRARLLGLDTPIKIEQDITTWNGDDSIDRAVKDLAALFRANSSDGASESELAGSPSQTLAITANGELADMADSLGARMGQDENGRGVDSLGSNTPTKNPLGGNSQDPR